MIHTLRSIDGGVVIDTSYFRHFAGIDMIDDSHHDESKILNFRYLLGAVPIH